MPVNDCTLLTQYDIMPLTQRPRRKNVPHSARPYVVLQPQAILKSASIWSSRLPEYATSSKRTKIGRTHRTALRQGCLPLGCHPQNTTLRLDPHYSLGVLGLALNLASLPPERGPSPAWLPLDSAITCYLGR